jgi:hypothetical protein
MKPTTAGLIAAFRVRRAWELTPDQRAVRDLAAESIRFRRQHWGRLFTQQHEAAAWNRREHAVAFRLVNRNVGTAP